MFSKYCVVSTFPKKYLFNIIGVAFEVIGTLIGIAIYTLFYALIVKGQEDDCADDVRTYNSLKVLLDIN